MFNFMACGCYLNLSEIEDNLLKEVNYFFNVTIKYIYVLF